MTRFNSVPPPPGLTGGSTTGIDVDQWTLSALQSLSVSPVARGTGTPLSIPLDDGEVRVRRTKTPTGAAGGALAGHRMAEGELVLRLASGEMASAPRRPPSARDSLKKREALRKGNEGSRQRRRWENDRLVGVPNAQPALPIDCLPHPTHPVQYPRYQIAQYWDKEVRQRVEEKTSLLQAARKRQQMQSGSATGIGPGQVPRDLRENAKRSPIVRQWLQELEEPIRSFLVEHHGRKECRLSSEAGGGSAMDQSRSEDSGAESDDAGDQIVFKGRKGGLAKTDTQWKLARKEGWDDTVRTGVVLESGVDAKAAHRRWLTYTISDYYGLEAKSVPTGTLARKALYVGVKNMEKRKSANVSMSLPRPLWEVC